MKSQSNRERLAALKTERRKDAIKHMDRRIRALKTSLDSEFRSDRNAWAKMDNLRHRIDFLTKVKTATLANLEKSQGTAPTLTATPIEVELTSITSSPKRKRKEQSVDPQPIPVEIMETPFLA